MLMNQNHKTSCHTLYLCYSWLNEPLVQTQVLPYLRELQKDGIKVSLMTFEREMSRNWTGEQIEEQRLKLAQEGIDWYALPYHKSPSVPVTLYDIYNGMRLAHKLIRERKVDVLHARVHVPALMAAIARKFSRRKPKMIFDIRGFMAEEYTDAGTWKPNGILFRTLKRVERWLMHEADAFVVLTEAARKVLFPESRETGRDRLGRPVEVIPCCIDRQRFQAADNLSPDVIRRELNLDGRNVIVHTGSLSGLYLTDKIVDLLAVYRQKDASVFALILTQSDPDLIISLLRKSGFTDADFLVTSVSPDEVPRYLKAANIAVSFVKSGYATVSRSPTKIPEYLACGLPVISNTGVGDVDEQIQTDRTGALVEDLTPEGYLKALQKIEDLQKTEDLAASCRSSAWNRFDLKTIGREKYRRLYDRLMAKE